METGCGGGHGHCGQASEWFKPGAETSREIKTQWGARDGGGGAEGQRDTHARETAKGRPRWKGEVLWHGGTRRGGGRARDQLGETYRNKSPHLEAETVTESQGEPESEARRQGRAGRRDEGAEGSYSSNNRASIY